MEFDDTVGWRVGPVGRGVPTIIEMVRMTRLDCVLGSAALMRAASAQAVHHATHRSAFGGPLRDKPLMAAVLADLALESEAATALAAPAGGRRGRRRGRLRPAGHRGRQVLGLQADAGRGR